MSSFGWPQIVMVGIITLNLYNELILHGEPETGFHNFWTMLFAVIVEVFILKAGGFF